MSIQRASLLAAAYESIALPTEPYQQLTIILSQQANFDNRLNSKI